MTEEEEFEAFQNYDKLIQQELADEIDQNNLYLSVIKNQLTKYKYNKLIEYLEETGYFKIKGIKRKNKVYGKKQTEPYWFKYVYITQSCGCCGDDFSGTIFIPITDKHFLEFYYEC